MNRCIAVFGPTASGKSGLAFALAKAFHGVIISADSMQIYKGMDIGTAKPTSEEMAEIPHKMIDICQPNDSFSVYDYKIKAEQEIENAIQNGYLPILVGGTGMYFDALFYNTEFGEMEISPALRASFQERVEKGENAALLQELFQVDPETAAPLHEKDSKRIVRGLEVYYTTGKPLSQFKAESKLSKSRFDFLKLYLVYENRENLYHRINKRVEEMVESGLLRETKALDEAGVFSGKTASQAIGYKEILPHLREGAPLEDCISLLKQKTRNYAKRQITWFKRYEDALPLIMDGEENPYKKAEGAVNQFLKG